MNAKIWSIPGGIHPPENKHQSTSEPIGTISLPDVLVLPIGNTEPCVNVGDSVLAGQTISEPFSIMGVTLHAPSSGVIQAIEPRPLAHASGLEAPCIVIALDGKHTHIAYEGIADYRQLPPSDLVEKIKQAGIAGLGGAGFPTAIKLTPKQAITTLILNGTECEPYITADDMIMRERADDIIQGCELLAYILGQPKKIIGIEDNKPEALAAMRQAAEGYDIDVISFPTKYPSGGEKQLIQILTGKEIPSGAIPAHLGMVMQNVATAAYAYRAIVKGEPLTRRITTVVGENVKHQRNIDALIGTPVRHILNAHGIKDSANTRVIMGGPMMGFTLSNLDAPLVKTTNCLLVPSLSELPLPPPAQPCIRCGLCAEVCPAKLLPQQLYWYSKAEDYDRAERYNLFDCIECGACSYVCPSSIPLVQYYRAAKGNIRQQQEEKRKSDHARARFEFRKTRMEREEAEKAAKREARKQAAQAAKAAKASPSEPSKVADPVAEALARVNAKAQDPAAQLAKLERAVSTAKERLTKAKNRLIDAEASQEDALKAKVKQAEKRLSDAEHSLQGWQKDHAQVETTEPPVQDAATQAIEKAKRHSEHAQTLTDEEKLNAKKAALLTRLEKATTRLAKATEEEDPNLDAFANSVEKLKSKLAELEETPHGAD